MNFTSHIIDGEWRNGGMKLFDKIRILRKARGLSQEQLGYSLSRVNKDGISRQTVSDWENGKFEPKLDNIRDLAEVFDVSFDALLDESVDLEDEKVLEAVLNQQPYKNRNNYEEETVVEDVPSPFKNKRITSWRTAILMAVSVSMMLTGITWLYNFVSAAVTLKQYSSSMGNNTQYISVIIYGVVALTILALSGVAFGFSLNAALRKKESRKAVTVLIIVLLAFFATFSLFINISGVVTYTREYIRDKNLYGNESAFFYLRIVVEYWFSLVLNLLENGGMLALVIWAHKKLAVERNEFKQVK